MRRTTPSTEFLRGAFQRSGHLAADAHFPSTPDWCSHHDEEGRTLARVGDDYFACWQCGKWWWARNENGAYLPAPRRL